MTVTETADALRVSKPTLYRLIRAGAIAPVRVGERLRLEPSEIRRYLDSTRTVAAP